MERQISDYQNRNSNVQRIEAALEDLKTQMIPKKELRVQRNRLAAELCRERSKCEVNFLKDQFVKQQRRICELEAMVRRNSSPKSTRCDTSAAQELN